MHLQRKNQQEEGSQQKNKGSKPLISTISKDPNKRQKGSFGIYKYQNIPSSKMEERTFLHTCLKFQKKGGGLAVNSRGASREIGILWHSTKFDLVYNKSHSHCIFTQLLHKNSCVQVCLFNIYVPVFLSEKEACWDLVREFSIGTHLDNIILAGDINVTLYQFQKRGGSVVRDPI